MSGRGNGSSRGRGRGSSRNSRSASNKKSTPPPKKEMKFTTQTPGKTVYETHATVREYILQRIQKNYDSGYDIVQAIKDGKDKDWDAIEPIMEMAQPDSSISDEDEREKTVMVAMTLSKPSRMEKTKIGMP